MPKYSVELNYMYEIEIDEERKDILGGMLRNIEPIESESGVRIVKAVGHLLTIDEDKVFLRMRTVGINEVKSNA